MEMKNIEVTPTLPSVRWKMLNLEKFHRKNSKMGLKN
jgi:hypothetical protein